MIKPSLLITARDPSSAYAVNVLLEENANDDRFNIHLLVQHPAFNILKKFANTGVKVTEFIQCKNDETLLHSAKRIIEQINPDIVLVGISGPGYGVDEAVLTVVQKKSMGLTVFKHIGVIPMNVCQGGLKLFLL